MKRVLSDHCVPKPLRRELPGEEVRTCFEQGWATLRNGELLAAAETAGFDVFVTADKNMRYPQKFFCTAHCDHRIAHEPALAFVVSCARCRRRLDPRDERQLRDRKSVV